MTSLPIPEKYQSDFLFLLVGTNPLPDFVAARLLTRQSATVYLLHSDGIEGPSTKRIAEKLEMCMFDLRPDLRIRVQGISENNNIRITDALGPLLKGMAEKNPASRVGLHYTGGTKPMAVHTYRLVKQFFPDAVFSYLDPRRLALQIDGQGAEMGVIPFFLARDPQLRAEVETDLEQLIDLHHYEPYKGKDTPEWADPAQTPGMLGLCQAIAGLWANKGKLEQWRRWMNTERFQSLPDPVQYPHLQDVRVALDAMCGGPGRATPDAVGRLLRPHDPKATLVSCSKWFIGAWLEDWVPVGIQQAAAALAIKSVRVRQKYRSTVSGADSFELDGAFMVGYQLFAVSCIATEQKEGAQEHLFEAYVRARQLGGDEARVGLVCCMDDTRALRDEIERMWDAKGKIWVCGRDRLENLPGAFQEWVKTANP